MSNNKYLIYLMVFILISGCSNGQDKKDNWPVLKGPYIGQKPPGIKPEIFAPGIVTTDIGETCPAFSPDGNRFIFMRYDAREWDSGIKKYSTLMTELKNGRWTKPTPLPLNLNPDFLDWDHNFGPDSKSFYFTSRRPQSGKGPAVPGDIWMICLTETGWSRPQRLPYPINTDDFHDANPCFTRNGTLYFTSQREGGYGRSDLYRTKLANGKYAEAENLGPAINTEFSEFDLQIAPDESYIVFVSNRPGGHEVMGYKNDLYVSFRKKDSTWTAPKNLGDEVNSRGGVALTLTSDGKYLLFTGKGNEPNSNIYWVSTKVIDELRPYASQKPGGKTTEIYAPRNGYSTPHERGKIVFCSDREGNNEIYVMNEDGAEQHRLTYNNCNDVLPKFSPDGKQIVFLSDRNGPHEIFIMSSDGSAVRQITSSIPNIHFPSFSSDGAKLIFNSREKGEPILVIMDMSDGKTTRYLPDIFNIYHPAWSPLGDEIAFDLAADLNQDIYIANTDGSGLLRLTENPDSDFYPAWSPDGKQIAFISGRNHNLDICVMKADGSSKKYLTSHEALDEFPSWGPDGRHIVFESRRTGKKQIFIISSDGADLKQITFGDYNNYYPNWCKVQDKELK